jgi:hypothetical protein
MDTASPIFSRNGLGIGLADVFEKRLTGKPPLLLRSNRGRQLLIVCDIGGSLKEQPFETFSFLILDLDRNMVWLQGQSAFRHRVMVHRRRMAFKKLNDANRRRALLPFLSLAEKLTGNLVTFAIDKKKRPKMENGGAAHAEISSFWKPSVVERLMWLIFLGAFLVSGFSVPGQDVMLIIDEDEVAANVRQLTKLTELFGRAVGNQAGPMMGHLRCGTTKSDDGSYALEDLAALPDLVAGATAEFVAALAVNGLGPISPLIQLLPAGVSWKTRTIMPWALNASASLDRFVCLIDGAPGSSKWRVSIPGWFRVESTFASELLRFTF